MRSVGWLLLATAAVAAPAHAGEVTVNAPAGRAGDAAVAIARQTGTSIIVSDPRLAGRKVRAIRGRFSAAEAVERLARAAGARAIPAGAMGWRLVAAPRPAPATPRKPVPPAAPRPVPPPVPVRVPVVEPQEIVVIGSKRDIPLRDFPGQVEMIDGEALTFGGVGGTEKITRQVPTVSSTYLGSGRNKLFIRGIADSSFTGPTQSTVGQYYGDLRLSYNAPDPDLRLSDLARVEVLEGPQGTLYGAGSLGGILRLVPNEPEMDTVSGSAMLGGSATWHGAIGGDLSATANLPLIADKAAMRVTVNAETQGGYIDKPLLGRTDVNRTNIYGGRATMRLEPGDGWTVDLVGIGQWTDGQDSQYADRDGPPLTRAAQVPEGFDADYLQGQAVVSGGFGDVLFRSSSGITGQDLQERYDATLPGGSPRIFEQENRTRMIANETRLWQPLDDRFGWLAGASFTHNSTRLTRALKAPEGRNAATGVLNEVNEATVYGEASVRLVDGLIATAGARYTRSRLSGEGEDVAPALAMALSDVTASRTETAFLPSGSIAATVLPDTVLYFRYQEGFRPGGLAIAGDFVTRFRNDRVSTLEFGGRHGQAGTGPFDLAASLAFTRWRDIQADFIDSAGFPSTSNIGDGSIWTASVTGGVALGPDLRLDAGMTYNDSHVDEPAPMLLTRVTQVPNIANFSGRVGFAYRRPLGRDLELSSEGWAQYIGRSRLGVGPELGQPQGDYLDTGLVARIGRDRLGVTVALTNLTDEVGNRFALGTPFAIGRDQVTPLRPRTIRIGLDAAF